MRPSQAAALIGCSVGQVRTLIRKGTIRAVKIRIGWNPGYYWDIDPTDVEHYRRTPQPRGYPRGKPRRSK